MLLERAGNIPKWHFGQTQPPQESHDMHDLSRSLRISMTITPLLVASASHRESAW